MEILYSDRDILVCIKPSGVLSTDEPGGLPELVRRELGDPNANLRTVHRLDRVVSGLMVLARSARAASFLSKEIREDRFLKCYLAVVHGCPPEAQGSFQDLLRRDKAERKTYVTEEPGKDVRPAVLNYRVLASGQGLSLVKIQLVTGRTHQIRCQFSSRGLPLVGDRKYSTLEDPCPIALWSCDLAFTHPYRGEPVRFHAEPPAVYPWTCF